MNGFTARTSRRLLAAGAHGVAGEPEQLAALEKAVLDAFSAAQRCERKANRPPEPGAQATAAALSGQASEVHAPI